MFMLTGSHNKGRYVSQFYNGNKTLFNAQRIILALLLAVSIVVCTLFTYAMSSLNKASSEAELLTRQLNFINESYSLANTLAKAETLVERINARKNIELAVGELPSSRVSVDTDKSLESYIKHLDKFANSLGPISALEDDNFTALSKLANGPLKQDLKQIIQQKQNQAHFVFSYLNSSVTFFFIIAIACLCVLSLIVFASLFPKRYPKSHMLPLAKTSSATVSEHNLDSLTGLLNRAAFKKYCDQALQDVGERDDRKVAVLHIGLDRFKRINQTMGHAAGDQILQLAAKRLETIIHPRGLTAHFSADEFLVLLTETDDISEIDGLAKRIIKDLRMPYCLEQKEVHLTASLGISVYPDDDTETDKLINNAGLALSTAKFSGRNQMNWFTKDLRRDLEYRNKIEQDLKRAVANDEFLLYFQPQVDLNNDKIIGVEALVRWRHPQLGILTPAAFLDVAEVSGLIIQIGDIVLAKALDAAQRWEKENLDFGTIAINLSNQEFSEKNIVEKIISALTQYNVKPEKLTVEVIESVFLDQEDYEIAEALEDFRNKGIAVELDDFGTGYASLTHLVRLPISRLKIDRAFVSAIPENPRSCDIVRAIIELSKTLDIAILAEGVESDEQIQFLKTHGCYNVQGYKIAKPMPESELRTWFEEQSEHNNMFSFLRSA